MEKTLTGVEERIKRVIIDRLKHPDSGKIERNTPLIGKGLGLDSVGVLELVVGLEEEFKIFFDDSELSIEIFENIGSVAKYISGKLNHK